MRKIVDQVPLNIPETIENPSIADDIASVLARSQMGWPALGRHCVQAPVAGTPQLACKVHRSMAAEMQAALANYDRARLQDAGEGCRPPLG
ncbi:hypothetical protein ATE59_01045 [Sphingopyxis sp. A083]|nr:hypothetical protein ATE59_01045 [Sphingopyxis sp. A083]